jgi:hypothetical protein
MTSKHSSRKGSTSNKSQHGTSGHMSHSEAGRMGAEARWGHHGSWNREENNSRNLGDRSSQGTMNRSEAGRRGAESHWHHDNYSNRHPSEYQGRTEGRWRENDQDRQYDRSHQGHMSRSEASRRGAEARWGRDYNRDQLQDRSRQGGMARPTETRWERQDDQDLWRERNRSEAYRNSNERWSRYHDFDGSENEGSYFRNEDVYYGHDRPERSRYYQGHYYFYY